MPNWPSSEVAANICRCCCQQSTLCTPVAVSLASGMSDHRATEMPPPPLDDGVRLTSRLADNKFEDGASVGCLSLFSPRQTIPIAVGPGSSRWVDGDRLQSCPSCDVDFSSLHKHVTKRHCRRCGGVFCYTCTYDKATLRTPSCLPLWGSKASVHVCVVLDPRDNGSVHCLLRQGVVRANNEFRCVWWAAPNVLIQ